MWAWGLGASQDVVINKETTGHETRETQVWRTFTYCARLIWQLCVLTQSWFRHKQSRFCTSAALSATSDALPSCSEDVIDIGVKTSAAHAVDRPTAFRCMKFYYMKTRNYQKGQVPREGGRNNIESQVRLLPLHGFNLIIRTVTHSNTQWREWSLVSLRAPCQGPSLLHTNQWSERSLLHPFIPYASPDRTLLLHYGIWGRRARGHGALLINNKTWDDQTDVTRRHGAASIIQHLRGGNSLFTTFTYFLCFREILESFTKNKNFVRERVCPQSTSQLLLCV